MNFSPRPYALRLILAAVLLLLPGLHASAAPSASNKQPDAFGQYAMRPKSELSKLIYLFDSFNGTPLKIIEDGHEYAASRYMKEAKIGLSAGYRNEKAANLIKTYFYRSDTGIIYLKYPNGDTTPLRDYLLEKLQTLAEI